MQEALGGVMNITMDSTIHGQMVVGLLIQRFIFRGITMMATGMIGKSEMQTLESFVKGGLFLRS